MSNRFLVTQSTRPVLLSTAVSDGATIIEEVGTATGFPASNLQDIQPRRKWHSDELQAHIILDLQQGPNDIVPPYNVFSLLFHNARPNVDEWRIQTGNTPTGTGRYDSGFIPLWPVLPEPDASSFRSSLFYRPLGAHSYNPLGLLIDSLVRESSPDEPEVWFDFPGDGGDLVSIGPAFPGPDTADRFFVASIRFRNEGGTGDQMLLTKGVDNVNSASFTGYYIGLLSTGEVAGGMGSGPAGNTVNVSGGSYADGLWHTATLWTEGVGDTINLAVDGVQVDQADASVIGDPSNASSTRIGLGATGSDPLSGQVERVFVAQQQLGGELFDDWLEYAAGWMNSPTPASDVLRLGVLATAYAGTTVPESDTFQVRSNTQSGTGGLVGDASANFTLPPVLADRYVRIDIERQGGTLQDFTAGRLVIGQALQPIVPYGTGLPTPIGSPPKLQMTWPVHLTTAQREEIAYGMMFNRGNAPEVVESWGHDIHLIDGGKTVVSVNDMAQPEPWEKHQGTVYGYIDSLEEVTKERTGLTNGRLTVRGM